MDKTTIRALKYEVPLSPIGEVPNDFQIWEADDGRAHLKVTRHELHEINYGLFILTVSGIESERQRIMTEFIEVLGEPSITNVSGRFNLVAWAYPGENKA